MCCKNRVKHYHAEREAAHPFVRDGQNHFPHASKNFLFANEAQIKGKNHSLKLSEKERVMD